MQVEDVKEYQYAVTYEEVDPCARREKQLRGLRVEISESQAFRKFSNHRRKKRSEVAGGCDEIPVAFHPDDAVISHQCFHKCLMASSDNPDCAGSHAFNTHTNTSWKKKSVHRLVVRSENSESIVSWFRFPRAA